MIGRSAQTPPARTPPGKLGVWLQAIRPRTLGASLAPVLVGSAVAFDAGRARPAIAALCALCALALQIATNLANDAYDFLSGVDGAARIGPTRAAQSGALTPAALVAASLLCVGLAVIAGGYLVWVGGWVILAIGLAAIAAALGYSAGPFPLASHGLGEVAAFLFFGVAAVWGTAYLHLGEASTEAALASLGVAALIANLMVVNNLRDIATDSVAGKRTLAVRIGSSETRRLYSALLALAYAMPAVLLVRAGGGWAVLLPWLTLPWAWSLVAELQRAGSAAAFQGALLRTARLHAVYSALLAVGLAV